MVDFTGADGGLRELALFAGAGGGILGGHLLGWRTVCAVEWEPYAASVLAQRQNDLILPAFPIWDDVRTFDGRPWRGVVDVVSGGFPCQDISVAGKGAGITGERSGMWSHMARIVGEVRPRFVFVENSPALLTRGLGVVLSDLAALGYDCRWTVLGAADVGAPHQRDRFWLVANANMPERRALGGACDGLAQRENSLHGQRQEGTGGLGASGEALAHTNCLRESQPQGCEPNQRRRASDSSSTVHHAVLGRHRTQESEVRTRRHSIEHSGWWLAEPDVGRVADGVAARVDRLKAIGNGQVPRVAATAFSMMANN